MSIEIATGLILKFLGAMAGAALALIFVPPRTRTGFIRRGAAALICGPIFGPFVQSWIGFSDTWEGVAAGSCLTAYASWWIMGAAKRWIYDKWPVTGQED